MREFIKYNKSVFATDADEKEFQKKLESSVAVTKDSADSTAEEAALTIEAEAAAIVEADTEIVSEVDTGEVALEAVTEEFVEEPGSIDGVEGEFIAEPMPIIEGEMVGDMMGDIGFDDGMYSDPMMETGIPEAKDPLLSSWPFVIGISAAVLFVSVLIGALLARIKIKKGIELYED